MTGTIKKLVADRHFGFISAEGMDKDLFFHGNSVTGGSFEDLHEGDAVSFETENGPKGMSAVNVARA